MAGRSFATRTEWCVLPLTHPTLRVGFPLSRGAGGGLFPVDGESPSPAPREREGPAPPAVGGEGMPLVTALIFRYSSLAALVAAVGSAVLAPFLVDGPTAAVIAGIALLIVLRHHANIRRLIAGSESRISLTKG